ncbi:hypothetical protein D3C73_1200860 [compost metagenome]
MAPVRPRPASWFQLVTLPEKMPQIWATDRSTAEPALLNGMVTEVATEGICTSAP